MATQDHQGPGFHALFLFLFLSVLSPGSAQCPSGELRLNLSAAVFLTLVRRPVLRVQLWNLFHYRNRLWYTLCPAERVLAEVSECEAGPEPAAHSGHPGGHLAL